MAEDVDLEDLGDGVFGGIQQGEACAGTGIINEYRGNTNFGAD